MRQLLLPLMSLLASFAGFLAVFALFRNPAFPMEGRLQDSESQPLEAPASKPAEPQARLRRPVAMALADHGRWLFVANQRSGTVTTIDTNALRVVAETAVGGRLSDLISMPDGRHLLATDEQNHCLVVLERHGECLEPVERLDVSHTPVGVVVTPDGSHGYVVSLWSRRLSVIDLTALGPGGKGAKLRVSQSVALSFAPRKQLLVPGRKKLIVAETFGGRLAVIDVSQGTVESVRDIPAHNIRGLALSGDGQKVLVTHQVLNSQVPTTLDEIHWGNVITNNVRELSLDKVLDPGADLLRGSRLYHLGEAGRGAGDPAGLTAAGDGTLVVALGGVGELALGPDRAGEWKRVTVGHRPTAVLKSSDGKRAYVANTFGDSVSVVRLSEGTAEAEVVLGPLPPLHSSDRGEQVFYDARQSHHGWFSCHSCHSDGHSNGLLNDNLGDDSFGAPKRVLSLLGVRDSGPWAWNGGVQELEAQIRKSLRSTMHADAVSEANVQALSAYLHRLEPPPGLGRFSDKVQAHLVERGREVFRKHSCDTCHTPPLYTSAKSYTVGLSDEVGNTRFNPPSLRGVSQAGPYFHDNRAPTLEDVFTRHQHQLKGELADNDLSALVAFLRSL